MSKIMENYIRMADEVAEFESDFNNTPESEHTKYTLAIQQDELKAKWKKAKTAHDEILAGDTLEAGNISAVKIKHKKAYAVYLRCMSNIATRQATLNKPDPKPEEQQDRDTNIRLPPCDTDVFKGDYLSWPTFRDLFTAIYILNRRLTPVERLYHLIQKTQGEAKEIVQKCPLTNEGFGIAWQNLVDRYENKRILVNTQLKTLFSLEAVEKECGTSIKKLQRDINNCIASLKTHQIDVSNWDAIITYLCSTKLPKSTLALWEQTVENKTEISKWEDMDKFLQNRFQTLETVSGITEDSVETKSPKAHSGKQSNENSHRKLGAFQTSVTKGACKMCKSTEHKLQHCQRFRTLAVSERIAFIKSKRGCINCLSSGHTVSRCSSSYNCATCQQRHNTLLHIQATNSNKNTANTNPTNNYPGPSAQAQQRRTYSNNQSNGTNHFKACFTNTSKGVLLGTARINIFYNNTNFSARALIDSGSECTFITERLKRRINLPSQRMSAHVSGITNQVSAQVKEACHIQLRSPIDPTINIATTALVLPQLTGNLPTCKVDAMAMQAFPNLVLADKRFFVNEQVDLILGGDIYAQVMLGGIKKDVLGTLLAQETVFGWILTGQTETILPSEKCVSFFSEVKLDRELRSFWEIEEVPKHKSYNNDDRYCEELYKNTTIRNDEGKYTVSLPFKQEFPKDKQLGPSLKIACSQFFRMETRLAKDPPLQAEYNRVLAEYETLGHMSRIPEHIPSEDCDNYFLPHHAVKKEESTTTKVRVVFNASSSTANGVSLNDVLHPGPVLQNDLPTLIMRWRFYRYVFNSDIEKMYRQILLHPDHTKYQRIVFRTENTQPIKLYELKTVTFGVNCAPYLAIRTLLQLATDVENTNPIASEILRKAMYVDDVLAGGHTLGDAIHARNEISTVLGSAGFSLRKWTANCDTLLKGLPKAHLLNEDFLDFEDASMVKALGIRWNALSDNFYFTTKPIEDQSSATKRKILSAIAKLFDPLGWLAPFVVSAKMLMQSIWLDGTGWDENVSPAALQRWESLRESYKYIEQIQIPRWVHYSPIATVEIHGFCDASEKAYAASIYLRVKVNDQVFVNLLLAKSRVAPVKTISLPRLELCGAVLLAETLESVNANLSLGKSKTFLWTDSTIVLAWIQKPPCSWSTFVAHRITKIIDKVGNKDWRHVESASNPADLASRGLLAQDLIKNSLWWEGPSWLQQDGKEWPNQETDFTTTIEEKKTKIQVYTTAYTHEDEDIIARFSDLSRALRVLSYVHRFYEITHPKISFTETPPAISPREIKATLLRLIANAQRTHYAEEFRTLKEEGSIRPKSELLSLHPFLDEDEIIRVGGRLAASKDLSYNERHPIILPYQSGLSRLITRFVHKISLHGGNQLMLRLIRTQYWIPRVKNMIRSEIHKCKICTVHRKQAQTQLMGILPIERTTYSRAFTNTGVDLAGPFEIKNYQGRGCRVSKGYVCLFVCFSTKAIHLEATTDLSTRSFLAAFARFSARRGCPKNVYSDNGTNFVGASRALRAEFKAFMADSRAEALTTYAYQNLDWHFIPASAPHMGGLWEAGVKSFKSHFKRVASNLKFTFEEFSTLLCRIESCLNSRPLTPASNQPSDLEPLTPGHFLVGGHLLAPPEPDADENPASIINRWQRLKALHHSFCRRWKTEYLVELQKRNKWRHPKENIKIDDLVVIKEDNLQPNEWRLGRVVKLHPGADGRVRVVELRTAKGQVTRPLVKLVVLPAPEDAQEPKPLAQKTNSHQGQ